MEREKRRISHFQSLEACMNRQKWIQKEKREEERKGRKRGMIGMTSLSLYPQLSTLSLTNFSFHLNCSLFYLRCRYIHVFISLLTTIITNRHNVQKEDESQRIIINVSSQRRIHRRVYRREQGMILRRRHDYGRTREVIDYLGNQRIEAVQRDPFHDRNERRFLIQIEFDNQQQKKSLVIRYDVIINLFPSHFFDISLHGSQFPSQQ